MSAPEPVVARSLAPYQPPGTGVGTDVETEVTMLVMTQCCPLRATVTRMSRWVTVLRVQPK